MLRGKFFVRAVARPAFVCSLGTLIACADGASAIANDGELWADMPGVLVAIEAIALA
jgi:hypothetical protein